MKKTKSPKIIRLAAANARHNLIQNKLLSTRTWHALVAAAAVFLLVSAAGVNLSISTAPPSAYFGRLTNLASAMFTPVPSLPVNLQKNTPFQSPLFFAGHDEEKPLVPPAITEFLKTYSLSKFDNAFYDALRFRQFKRVAEDIYRASGYELIRFDHLPGFIREEHAVLSYPLGPGEQEAHFVLWQPLVRINRFYYTYKGHDVFFLQKKVGCPEFLRPAHRRYCRSRTPLFCGSVSKTDGLAADRISGPKHAISDLPVGRPIRNQSMGWTALNFEYDYLERPS